MPSYYDAVGIEPTYELAESIIRATVYKLKQDTYDLVTYPYFGYKHLIQYSCIGALPIIIKHFPDVLMQKGEYVYVKDSNKHLLSANDLLVMDYYLLLLTQYEERIAKYQQYLKKQQDRQKYKLLFVLFMPFILIICMFLIGD